MAAADGTDAGQGAHAAVHPLPAPLALEPRGARPDAAAHAHPGPAHPAVLPESEQLQHLTVGMNRFWKESVIL